jgi:hypothetical protein
MTPESRKSLLLGNGSVITFPRKRTRTTIEEPVSKQWIDKHTTIGVLLETVFSVRSMKKGYKEVRSRKIEFRSWQLVAEN